jgi:hypothetical protein
MIFDIAPQGRRPNELAFTVSKLKPKKQFLTRPAPPWQTVQPVGSGADQQCQCRISNRL